MCTLTIFRQEHRITVTMNRDDLIARAEAGPRLSRAGGPAFAAPRDLQTGGTWIGVNQHGVVACLLNRYDKAPAGRVSRGNIVTAIMRAANTTSGLAELEALDHRLYAPFTCVIASYAQKLRFDWDGAAGCVAAAAHDRTWMTTSSSWALNEVRAQRAELFSAACASGGGVAEIGAFHCRPIEGGDAWAPMMKRAQSQTKSVTQIELEPGRSTLRYWPRERAIANGLRDAETSFCLDRT